MIEGIFIGIRLIGFPLIAIWAAGPLIGIVFTIVQLMVFRSCTWAARLRPTTREQPIVPKDVKIDFLRRQT